jgi:hypothetical protein
MSEELLPLLLTPLVLAVSAAGPGAWLLRRRGWSLLERAAAVPAASILAVGLVSFGLGVARLHPWLRFALAAACTVPACLVAPAIASALRGSAEARRGLAALLLLAAWLLALAALVRNFSGGNWYGDWSEHYERSRFFFKLQPWDTRFLGYLLPARPPLMNAFAAQILAVTGGRYAVYQATATLWASLTFLPALLLARLWAGGPRLAPTVAVLLGFQPMFVANADYPWTKMQAAFFLLLAIVFYVRGWREEDGSRLLFAAACGAGALLTHYSTLPALVFLAAHAAFALLPRRRFARRALLPAAALGLALLAPWFLFSLAVYGSGATAASAAESTGKALPDAGSNVAKIALNIRDTIVPHLLRGVPSDPRIEGRSWGALRDTAFTLYTRNLPFALGVLGLPLLLFCAAAARRAPPGPAPPDGRGFWLGLALWNVVAGLAVYGGRDPLGLAYSAQQPVVILAAAYLASRFASFPRPVRLLAAAGAVFDLLFGVLLNAFMQTRTPDVHADWRGPLGLRYADLQIGLGAWNWDMKTSAGYAFIADRLGGAVWLAGAAVVALATAGAVWLLREARRDPDQSSRSTSASSVATST